jgi:hypothetical protein
VRERPFRAEEEVRPGRYKSIAAEPKRDQIPGMVNIRIFVHGDEESPSYEKYPYILTISRVPCVGEDIHSNGSTEGGVKRQPGLYKVTDVMHYTNTLDLAARVTVEDAKAY